MAKAKYQVIGTVTFQFDIEVQADSEEDAEECVLAMNCPDLVEKAGMPDFEFDSVLRLKGARGR